MKKQKTHTRNHKPITLTLTPYARQALVTLSDKVGMSMSETVCYLLTKEAAKNKVEIVLDSGTYRA